MLNNGTIVRLGKDEVNLVERPWATLSTRPAVGSLIEHEWETRHPITGKTLKAVWTVSGHAKLGLPTTTDEKLYLVLMELTREASSVQEVSFVRHDLLRRIGKSPNQRGYAELRASFERLNGVAISSHNAFWDASSKSFVSTGFSLIDQYQLVDSSAKGENGELPLSSFRWNDVVFKNIVAGYIRSINLGFALSLELPLSLRLYRYLDKKRFDGKRAFEIELHKLCDLHLGMAVAKHNSVLKQRLKSAHEELIRRGFLIEVSYLPMKTREGEKVRYSFGVNITDDGEPTAPIDAAPKILKPKAAKAPDPALPPAYLAACEAAYAGLPPASRAIIDREAAESGVDYRQLVWKYHNQDVGRELGPTRR